MLPDAKYLLYMNILCVQRVMGLAYKEVTLRAHTPIYSQISFVLSSTARYFFPTFLWQLRAMPGIGFAFKIQIETTSQTSTQITKQPINGLCFWLTMMARAINTTTQYIEGEIRGKCVPRRKRTNGNI